MIGGRVLDATMLAAFASCRSEYAQALVWAAVESDVVLVVPATALAAAWAATDGTDRPVLDVLVHLHVTVVDDLTADRARAVGVEGGPTAEVHALLCATDRSWPLVTAEPGRYAGLRPAGAVTEALP